MNLVTSVPALPDTVASYHTNITDPTARLYSAFIGAYDFFNKFLFEDRLPRCVITLRANRSRLGCFAKERFKEGPSDNVIDEIALNPKAFKNMSVEEVLSTLVHEMTHLEQFRFGRPSRAGYHNKEWGKLMKRVGLYPSNTGRPAGKETGQQMHHYIIEGGLFTVACRALIETGFTIEYADIWRDGEKKESEKNKSKYTCTECGFNAWAKPNAENLACLDCGMRMVEVA
jgi:predicted SprT family Zn-dependent metalloprotease